MNNGNGWSRGLKIFSALAVAWFVAWGVLAWINATSAPAALVNPPSPTPTQELAGPRDADGKCKAAFVQKDISDTSLNRPVKKGLDAKTAAKSRDKLIAAFGHSGLYLRDFVLSVNDKLGFDKADIPSAKAMIDKDCLSQEGYNLWVKVRDDLKGSKVSFDKKPPKGMLNSGWFKNQLVVAKRAGVSGKTKVLVIKLSGDRGTIYILVRCGNPLFTKVPPGIPKGPTDEPPPDECPKQPGNQPPGTACSKAGQRGSIANGNHDPDGGKPDSTRNPLTPVEDERPVVTDREQAGTGSGSSNSGSGSGSSDSGSSSTTPPVVVDEGEENGPVEPPGEGW